MAILPQNNINLVDGVIFEQQPSKTFYIDPLTKRVQGTADGLTAVKQAVEIALSVERFDFGIYTANFGTAFIDLVGKDEGYVLSAISGRIKDALSVDNRIISVDQISHVKNGDKLTLNINISTVYGTITQSVEVINS